jgi:hypothetical protein
VQSEKTKRVIKKTVVRPKVMYSTLGFRNVASPNIIRCDFVNADVNETIIDMNDRSLKAVRDDGL